MTGVIISVIIIIGLALLVLLMVLYYINRKWFNDILIDLAGKIDPDGEAPHIDELPKLYKKEKLEFKEVFRTPLPPRLLSSQRPGYNSARMRPNAGITRTRKPSIFDDD